MVKASEIRSVFSKFKVGSDYSIGNDNRDYTINSEEMKNALREKFFTSPK
jgi:hypothetical protein